jgi:hypothetical protein
MRWYPRFGMGIVLLTNSVNHRYQTALPEQILDRFLAARFGETLGSADNTPRESIEPHWISPQRLAALAGQYLYGSGGYMLVVSHEGRLGTGPVEQFKPFTFVSEDVAVAEYGGEPFYYKFARGPQDAPARLIRLYDATVLDFNEGPNDVLGPDRAEWRQYEGEYRYGVFGTPSGSVEVSRRNGYLYLDHMKLSEHEPGLFFTANGEALDFRGPVPTWRNIRLDRAD